MLGLVLLLLPEGHSDAGGGVAPVVVDKERAPSTVADLAGVPTRADSDDFGGEAWKDGEIRGAATSSESATGENGRRREERLAKFAFRLAKLPTEEALARISELPDQESRDTALLALLGELSGMSSLEIIRSGDVWRFGAGGALAVHLLESGKISPSRAAEITGTYSDGNRRSDLYAHIGSALAANDPAAAVALGNDLRGWERRRFLESLAQKWSGEFPDEARRWIAGVADQETRDSLIAGLLQQETRNNPATAAANLLAMPPADESVRMRAMRRVASQWASQDTVAAMQWAGSLPEGSERSAAEQGIRSGAPVGIGAMLTRGDDNLPVIGRVIPGGPASTSGALAAGDAVLAVSGANGTWVDATRVSQRELVNLVRGDANTQVSLQVRSPGSSSPKVVTIGRQQIIFRPDQN